jgi:hypothetical protein
MKQRDLLNTWLRLYAREPRLPGIDEYQPARLEDELADLVYYTVDTAQDSPRLTIQSDGTRMFSAYGNTGKGRAPSSIATSSTVHRAASRPVT